jgi:hypothetical protein
MTPDAWERLRAHAQSIVHGASVPPADAADLTEEMLGHLIERSNALMSGGAAEDDAILTAIAEFGEVPAVSGELGRTYHSRLWVSTIGVLLTAREITPAPPGAIGGLRLLIVVEAALWTILGAVAIATETPLRAVVAAGASVVFVGSAVVAHRGLASGQAWAVRFSIALAFATIGFGLLEASNAPAGTTTIPLTAFAAAGVLLWVAGSWRQVTAFVEGSRPIGRRLEMALAAALLGPVLLGVAFPGLADPTQAGPADVDMRLSMVCGQRDLQLPAGGPLVRNRQYADLRADFFWRRSDVLPLGLAQVLGSTAGAGDTAGFRIIEPPPIDFENGGAMPRWMLDTPAPTVTVADTGEVAGWFGATSPSVALIPGTMGSFTVGVEPDRIRSGQTIHIGWSLGPTQDGGQPWPSAEVAYAHLDRFVLLGQVGCGQQTTGSAGRQPAPAQKPFMP